MKILSKQVPITIAAMLVIGNVYAGQKITCPANINQSIDDSVTLVGEGTCTLAANAEITNDVTVTSGVSFTVLGSVDGKIDEVGPGRVVVNGGTVFNDIIETGSGSVVVSNHGNVKGKIDESGSGRVYVNSATVENDILESDSGSVHVIKGGQIDGNVDEADGGNVTVDISSRVEGNVFEEGNGNCANVTDASVEGEIECD